MAILEHPAATQDAPVFAATMAQAVVDLAWEALTRRCEAPGRREITGWLDDHDEDRARRIASEIESAITGESERARWRAWREESLEGEDPFYDTDSIRTHEPRTTRQVQIVLRVHEAAR